MKKNYLRSLVIGTSMLLLSAPIQSYAESSWPRDPIKMIVGFAAGGPTDQTARLVAVELSKELGTSVVVESKPGANGAISIAEMKRQKADGYTLLFATSGPLAVAPARYKNISYDVGKDFEYIGGVSSYPSLLVTKVDNEFNSVEELVELSKKTPEGLSAGMVSSTQELTMARFKQDFGVNVVGVPYKGDSQSINDVVSGLLDFAFVSPSVALPMIESNRIKAIGVTGVLPPSFDARFERIEGFDVMGWNSIVVATGTPQDVQEKLKKALDKVLEKETVQSSLHAVGMMALPQRGNDLKRMTLDEIAMWERVMEEAGLSKL